MVHFTCIGESSLVDRMHVKHTVLYIPNCIYRTVYTVLYIPYCIYRTVYTVLYIPYCIYRTVYTVLYIPYCIYRTVYTVLYIPYCIYRTVYTVLYTPYCVYRTVYTVLCIPYCLYRTVYTVHCSVQYIVSFFFASLLYFLITGLMIFNILSMSVFYFVYSVFFCFFCIVSPFEYGCLFPIFVQVYRPLPPGGNPIAVCKYHTISYLFHMSTTVWSQANQKRLNHLTPNGKYMYHSLSHK
jgi:hypothetical protein